MRSTDLTSWANGIYFLLNFLVANSNWSAWYEQRLPNQNYFWRTNQPAILTAKMRMLCSTSLSVCNRSKAAPWCSSLMIPRLPSGREEFFA